MPPRTDELDDLLARVEKLERQRFQRKLGVAVLLTALCIAGPMFGQPPSEVLIQAQEIALVDKSGRTRALLSLSPEGEPSFTLHDRAGDERAGLKIFNDQPLLGMFDGSEITRIAITAQKGGAAAIAVLDESGVRKMGISVDSEEAGLIFRDKAGARIALLDGDKGGPSFFLLDEHGKVAFQAP